MSCATRPARRVGLRVQDYPDRPRTQLVRVLPRCCHNSHPPWIESLHQSRGGHHDSDGTATRPSRAFLLGIAAIDGGPTFIGTAVGHSFTSESASVVFLTLAAGAIVYVIAQLLGVAARAKRTDLLAGFITDVIVTAGGD
jgi:hypothetical protein